MQISKKVTGIISILLVIVVLSHCMENTNPDPRGAAFSGAGSCRQCHQSIYDQAVRSAHFNASALATKQKVHGNFQKGANSFLFDSVTQVSMEDRDSGLYQVLYTNNRETEAHRLDILFGFRHAQTFLFWNNNQTYELPVSYYRDANKWGTSPGFSAREPNFKRLIGKDCYECHSSFIRDKASSGTADNYFSTEGSIEVLEKNSLVFGIDCERCHGPAAKHVTYHLEHRDGKQAKYITSIHTLSRQQQLDNCAVCHSGNDQRKLKTRFRFLPGDTLSDFFLPSVYAGTGINFDVHGNQYRLLAESKCFIKTKTITCSTCHNPHGGDETNLSVYSQQCISCHNTTNQHVCTSIPAPDMSVQANCINCHMPRQASNAITFQLADSSTTSSYFLRTHKIGIYTNPLK